MRAWKCSMNLIFPGWLYTFFKCLKSKVALQMWRTRYESKSLCTSEGLPGPGWNPKDGDAWHSNDLQLMDMKFTYIYMNLRKSYDVKGDTLIDPSFQYKMKVCSFCRRKNLSRQMAWVLCHWDFFWMFWGVSFVRTWCVKLDGLQSNDSEHMNWDNWYGWWTKFRHYW